jgi:hypothetical protein
MIVEEVANVMVVMVMNIASVALSLAARHLNLNPVERNGSLMTLPWSAKAS